MGGWVTNACSSTSPQFYFKLGFGGDSHLAVHRVKDPMVSGGNQAWVSSVPHPILLLGPPSGLFSCGWRGEEGMLRPGAGLGFHYRSTTQRQVFPKQPFILFCGRAVILGLQGNVSSLPLSLLPFLPVGVHIPPHNPPALVYSGDGSCRTFEFPGVKGSQEWECGTPQRG